MLCLWQINFSLSLSLYTAIKFNSPWGPGQCPKSVRPYILQFRRYRGKSGLEVILPPLAGIRVNKFEIMSPSSVISRHNESID